MPGELFLHLLPVSQSLVLSVTGLSVPPSTGDCAPTRNSPVKGQLPGLERIPRIRICCCSSPTTSHYRQVMLFLFLELYLFYFLNSHQNRGGKKRSFFCTMIQTLTPDRPSNPLSEKSVG